VFGTHLLGRLAMPSLEETKNSRCVITTSGGMYGSKFPTWDRVLAREPKDKYNGVLAYSYAKRGQVLLAEEWGKKYTKTRIVTAHPGWAKTPGTAAAFGDQEKYLNPMRTPWEGADGICYLCCCDQSNLESGAFYLDRTPQVKHIAGPFFTEGSYTKNTKDEVAFMMKKLDAWNFGSGIERLASEEELVTWQAMKSKPLQEMDGTVDTPAFMGKWYVLAGIPTIFEKGGVNPTEVYTWNDKKNNIDVNFYLNKDAHTDKVTVFEQRATVNDIAVGTRWALCPKIGPVYAPINLAYLILHNENKATIIGVPNRDYVWIMARDPKMEEKQLDELIDKCGHLGYDRAKIMRYEHTRDITDDSNAEVVTEL
jgi:lipocalin